MCRSLVLANPLVPTLARLPERSYALVLRVPIERRIELDIVPPPGWRAQHRQPRRLEAEWGGVDESLEEVNGAQRSVLHITLPAQTVTPEDYPGFARFCQAVDELTTRPPRLERAGD